MSTENKPATPEKPARPAEKDARASRFVTPGSEIKIDKGAKTVTV